MRLPPALGKFTAAVAVVLWLLPTLAMAALPVQRMILVPGCYSLPPGGSSLALAYCLDRNAATPAAGGKLAPTAMPKLGDTIVRTAAGAMPLAMALQEHLIAVEGLGQDSYLHVRLRNLTTGKIGICVQTPTVLGADEGSATTDVTGSYGKITSILNSENRKNGSKLADNDMEARADIQESLWRIMDKAELQEWNDVMGPPSPTFPAAGPVSGKTRKAGGACGRGTDVMVLCVAPASGAR